jgi:hypothetical protein
LMPTVRKPPHPESRKKKRDNAMRDFGVFIGMNRVG